MAVDRAAISRTLSALTSQALVDRPTGSRPVISLSIEGRKILAAVELINDERMARIFSGFSLEEKESLIAYMDRLSENTDLLHLYSKNIRVSRGSTG
jgi:DNA-binding MarR family transcriptional regulator